MNEVLKCPQCGGQSVSYDTVKGAYYCEHCNCFFSASEDKKTRGLFEEVTRLRNLMNFEDALEILEEEESRHSDNAEIYFAKILARYGVTYVDEKGRISPIPTLSRASELSITTSNDYKKCLANASNSVLKKSYEERLDEMLDSIGSMRDDEIRARQQLEEIKSILKSSKSKIREYNLPVIPKVYFVELTEAQAAIKEIIKELDKKPITIETLNTRVDTARDLVLKLFTRTKEMMRTAMFAEMAIVYGNRYRSSVEDLDKILSTSELLFFKGEYKKSLELSINSLNRIEQGIYNKLLKLYDVE